MKNTLKKALSVLIALTVIFSSFAFGFADVNWSDFAVKANAEDSATSGTCGENLTWELNTVTGALTISGTGDMYDWQWNTMPWYNLAEKIKSVSVETGVTSIGNNAFYNNFNNLTVVSIGDSVSSIGEQSFLSCDNLKTVKLGKGISDISKQAFDSSSITDVYYNGTLAEWCGINFEGYASNPMVYAENLYINGTLLEGNIVIPDSVTSIGDSAFYGCKSITGVTIRNNVTSIGASAFSNCSGLTSITIPDSVTSIGEYAFYNCTGLTDVTFSGGEISFGKWTFEDCKNLKNITLPDGMTSISAGMFSGCIKLADISIPESVTSIGDSAFSDCSAITEIILPDSLETIGEDSFYGCSEITSITIPESVLSIGESSFAYCKKLSDIRIMNDETAIGGGAFYGTAAYNDEANIENGALYIDNILIAADSTFSGKFTIKEGTRSICAFAFYERKNITSIVIPEGVKYIGENAFCECTGLTSVTLPNSIKKIGKDAFVNCTNLIDVNYTGNASEWGSTEFVSAASNPMSYAKNLCFNGVALKDKVVFEEGTETINAYAFAECTNITSVTIPASVTSIGAYAFYNCTNLKDVYYNGDIAGWCSIDVVSSGAPLAYAKNLYIGGSLITGNIVIPEGVTEIAAYAFCGCSGITGVRFPESLVTIGAGAFKNCTSLNNVTIPVNVADIDSLAFYGCTSLDNVTWNAADAYGVGNLNDNIKTLTVGPDVKVLPSAILNTTITTLYYNAKNCNTDRKFVYCSNLSEVHIGESVERFGSLALYGTPFYNNEKNWTTIKTDGGTMKALIVDNCIIAAESASGNVVIPEGIRLIAGTAFAYCRMENIEFPESLRFICDQAFNQCINIEKVEIPKNVEYIGYLAFYSLRSAKSYNVDEENEWYSSDSYGVLFNKDKTELIQYPLGNKRETYRVPNTVTKILDYAFSGPSIADDKMGQEPSGYLVTVYIADSVEDIGYRCFYFTDTLINLNIGTNSNLKTIGKEAFLNCYKLSEKYLHIPEGVTEIGEKILNNGSKICSLTDECLAKEYADKNGHSFKVCEGHIYDDANVEDTTNPDVDETEPDVSVPSMSVPELTTAPIGAPVTKPSTEPSTKPNEVPSTTKPNVESTTKPAVETTTKPTIKEEIIKKPSTAEVKYGETLILHADFENIPDGATIEWSVEGEGVTIVPSEDGKTCAVTSTSTGDVTITAKYTDANGIEHFSKQEIKSNASFWQKIVSFFKNLFGISRIIEQVVKF